MVDVAEPPGATEAGVSGVAEIEKSGDVALVYAAMKASVQGTGCLSNHSPAAVAASNRSRRCGEHGSRVVAGIGVARHVNIMVRWVYSDAPLN